MQLRTDRVESSAAATTGCLSPPFVFLRRVAPRRRWPMVLCLIGLGSNLGDRAATLQEAIRLLSSHVGKVAAASAQHSTLPIGGPAGQPHFLNAATVCETDRSPSEVLAALQAIETRLGRRRDQRWDARTLDLDLLIFDDIISDDPELILPHPRMAFRRFVLEPACEIASAMIHPRTQFSLRELLARLDVKPIHVVVLGEEANTVARTVAERVGGILLDSKVLPQRDAPRFPSSIEFTRPVVEAWNHAINVNPIAVISDFWINEYNVGREQSGNEHEAAFSAEDGIPHALAFPHLVVWLETQDRTSEAGEKLQKLRLAVFHPRQFPVLVLPDVTLTDAIRETVAAIEAME